ncbi:MAG: hypothetical protein ACTSVI_11715 [Promethearchaeota archaeon]
MHRERKLSHYIKRILPDNFPERKNLTELIKIIAETSVPIRRLLEKGVSSRALSDQFEISDKEIEIGVNPSGETQIHEDLLTHSVFLKSIMESEIPISFLASEESKPVTGDGILGITIDPVDGSSNVAVNRTVGTIVGIWLQEEIVCSMYILYGVFTNMVISINGHVSEFLLSQDNASVNYNHFVFVRDLMLPDIDKKGYRCIGGDESRWHPLFKEFQDALIENGYKDRYSGSFVGDAHAILYKGGLYAYLPSPRGKLRLYYEWLPIAHIFEALGGKFDIIELDKVGEPSIRDPHDIMSLLKSNVNDLAGTVCGGIVGNKKSVEILEKIINKS